MADEIQNHKDFAGRMNYSGLNKLFLFVQNSDRMLSFFLQQETILRFRLFENYWQEAPVLYRFFPIVFLNSIYRGNDSKAYHGFRKEFVQYIFDSI